MADGSGTDRLVALTQLREVLLSDVSRAAPVLRALVGDVVIESRKVEGQKRPEMVATFTIDGIPALAALDRGKAAGANDPTVGLWEFLNADRWIMAGKTPRGRRNVVLPLRRTPKYEVMLPQIVEMTEAGSGIDLISRALGIGAEVVRDALHLQRTGKRPPGRVDGRRRQRRQPGQPFEPRYRRIAWAKLMARVGEEFPLECPGCGGDIRLIAFITDPGPIRKILAHLGEPLEPPPVSPARGPPTDWGELVQVHNECDVTQTSPDELPAIDIHSL